MFDFRHVYEMQQTGTITLNNKFVSTTIANISSMVYYDAVTEKSKPRNMPFYPDCNMRTLSEVNMTIKWNDKQEYTMEQIMRNEQEESTKYDLGSNMSLVLYEMTREKDKLSTTPVVSANKVDFGTHSATMFLPDRFATSVKVGTIRKALKKHGLKYDDIEGEIMCTYLSMFHLRHVSEIKHKQWIDYFILIWCFISDTCMILNNEGEDGDVASIDHQVIYVTTIYGADIVDLTTIETIKASRIRLNMKEDTESKTETEARRSFIDKLSRSTGIYAAPVEGATRLACARALMLQMPLPSGGMNKLDCSRPLSVTSPAFRTIVAVHIYGSGDDGPVWTLTGKTMQHLKKISYNIRGAQDASSTNDISNAYLELLRYAKMQLKIENKKLRKTYGDQVTHRIGTDAKTMARTTQVTIKGSKKVSTLEQKDMGPFEHLYANYLPKIAVWWLNNWGKHALMQKVELDNAKSTKGKKTPKDFIDHAEEKISDYARAQAFWFKTTASRRSGGRWISGVSGETLNLINFSALCLGNDAMIERTERFIYKMKENQFKTKQKTDRLTNSALNEPKFIEKIVECVRKVSVTLIRQVTFRGKKEIQRAFFAQAVVNDIFTFFETYGPMPNEVPMVFKEALCQTTKSNELVYTNLFQMVLDTYPIYLEKSVPYGFDETCLVRPYSTLYGTEMFPQPTFDESDWALGLSFTKWYTLTQQSMQGRGTRAMKKTASSTLGPPLSLMLLGKCTDEEYEDCYSEVVIKFRDEGEEDEGKVKTQHA